jgi:hypothetical protein
MFGTDTKLYTTHGMPPVCNAGRSTQNTCLGTNEYYIRDTSTSIERLPISIGSPSKLLSPEPLAMTDRPYCMDPALNATKAPEAQAFNTKP